MLSDRKLRLRGQKRVHEGEEMASNHHHHHQEQGKPGNLNRFAKRPTIAKGTIQNSCIVAPSKIGNARTGTSIKEEHLDHSSKYNYQKSISQRPKCDRTLATNQHDGSGGILQLSPSVVKYLGVKGFEDFKISVDGLILDSELPTYVKVKYYELCCSQQMFLHDHLITGLGSKLVTGVISKTSSIADAIKSASLTHSLHNLERWDKTLKAFEAMGMHVGFLRTRVDKLVKISLQYQTANQSKDAKFALVEGKKKALGEKISIMEALQKSIATLKESIKLLEAELEGVAGENEKLGLEFKKIAAASWFV